MRYRDYQFFPPALTGLLAVTFLLTILGLLFVYSASSVYALAHDRASDYYVRKQLLGAVLGGIAAVCIALLPIRTIKATSPLLFWGIFCITLLTLTPYGVYVRGSRRWISLLGVSFQPSEFLKIALILYGAYLIDRVRDRRLHFAESTLKILFIAGLCALLLLLQPDFGQAVAIMITVLAMLFVAGFPLRHFLYLSVPLIVGALALIIAKPYRLARIMTYLNPWNDPQGAGFQIIQSLIAIGSGKIGGVGIGQSVQKQLYLPMQHTDFIFSIIAEETGLIGGGSIILLFSIFLWCGFRCALACTSRYGALVVFGAVFLILVQASMNLGVVTGLLPTKGIGLPFLSSGSSSLIATLMLCGVIASAVLDSSPTSPEAS